MDQSCNIQLLSAQTPSFTALFSALPQPHIPMSISETSSPWKPLLQVLDSLTTTTCILKSLAQIVPASNPLTTPGPELSHPPTIPSLHNLPPCPVQLPSLTHFLEHTLNLFCTSLLLSYVEKLKNLFSLYPQLSSYMLLHKITK